MHRELIFAKSYKRSPQEKCIGTVKPCLYGQSLVSNIRLLIVLKNRLEATLKGHGNLFPFNNVLFSL